MLSGKSRVLEVGCADAFGTRVVLQEVGAVTAVDFDPVFLEDARARMDPEWQFEVKFHDMLEGPVAPGNFDAAYSMDVIEHIMPADEHRFVGNVAASLCRDGVLIPGSPPILYQAYASKPSKEGHVNCKDAAGSRAPAESPFPIVFI